MGSLHSQQHDIANQLYSYYGGAAGKAKYKMSFPLFLGLVKNRGNMWAFEKLSQMKDYRIREKKRMPIQFIMKRG